MDRGMQEVIAQAHAHIDRLQMLQFVAMCNGKPVDPNNQFRGPWLNFDMLARWRARGFRA